MQVLSYLEQHINVSERSTAVIQNTQVDQLLQRKYLGFRNIVTLDLINHNRRLTEHLFKINEVLPDAGLHIGCVETINKRRQHIYSRYHRILAHLIWFYCFVIHRIWPKIPYLSSIYFLLTKGKYRWISMAETMGRLVSSGFSIIEYKELEGKLFYVVMKTGQPDHNMEPSYAPLFPMKRIGKNGKTIKVYKIRTMHPFSEYLQDYVIKLNGYNPVGKPANDFRLTSWGKFFRKYWIDELPQLINVLRGNMAIVGMRPLSQSRFDELPTDIQLKRIQFKPGCIPPYVALNMPDKDANIEAERIYMAAKEKAPFLTDVKYFFMALGNILSGKIRSS